MRLPAVVASSSLALVLCGVCIPIACSSPAARTGGAAAGDASAADVGLPATGDASSDAGAVADPGCQPGSIAGFVPQHYIGPLARSTACAGFGGDGGLVQAYGDSCLSASATYQSCRGFSAPDAAGAGACLRCLASSAAPGTPAFSVVLEGNATIVNFVGCIEAVDPTEAGASCARTMEATLECIDYACKTACPPVVDDVSQNAYWSCANAAQTDVCMGYMDSAKSCVVEESANGHPLVATVCFGGPNTAEGHYLTSAQYFCGD